jgi:altronate dehydratase
MSTPANTSTASRWRNWAGGSSTSPCGWPAASGRSASARGTPRSRSGASGGRRARPTSPASRTCLCSGQIAGRIANLLNARKIGREGLSRAVALPHTEGCGVSSGQSEELYTRTLIGYLLNPLVGRALLLEHGCEKTHNDYVRHELRGAGVDLDRFGWASIQLDGGIESVTGKALDWFAGSLAGAAPPAHDAVGVGALRLALAAHGPLPPAVAAAFSRLARLIVGAGGTVVVPENSALLADRTFRDATFAAADPAPSLDYGQAASQPGLHIMATPTDHWVETLTGLGATGVEIVLAHIGERPVQAHRLIPVLQISADPEVGARYADDLDLVLSPDADLAAEGLGAVLRVAGREYAPKLNVRGNTDFQFTRGLLGVSM